MELRELQATDLFTMVRILNQVGFKSIRETIDFKKIMDARKKMKEEKKEENKEEILKSLGEDIVFPVLELLLEKLPRIENELYRFLGSLANMKEKDVAKLGINEFMDLLMEVIKKKEFVDFFKRASKLIK